jgi:hypothetical protein
LLLFGVPGPFPNISSSCSSSVSDVAGSLQGSLLVQFAACVCDYCSTDHALRSISSSSSPSNATILSDVSLPQAELTMPRCTVVELLMTESQALKYYKEEAHAALLYLAHKLDTQLLPQLTLQLMQYRTQLQQLPRSQVPDVHLLRKLFPAWVEHQTSLGRVLHNQKFLFEKGLSKLPSDGHSLPDLLRYERLASFMDLLRTKVDEDGFEFIPGQDGLVLIKDAEADMEIIGSDSDNDDDED